MYLNTGSLKVGNGTGYYSGATFLNVGGQLRLIGVGRLNS